MAFVAAPERVVTPSSFILHTKLACIAIVHLAFTLVEVLNTSRVGRVTLRA